MKKMICALLALALALPLGGALGEEENEDILARIEGQTFVFSSGVGAWLTSLTMGPEGTFAGEFHDSEMGEMGEDYPYGTVYGCLFHGQMEVVGRIDESTWELRVKEWALDEGQLPETIEDGIRYVTAAPYGLEMADRVTLYLPGAPVAGLPEGFLPWSHLMELDPEAERLPYYALWSEMDESGFITDPVEEDSAAVEGPENL